MRLGEKCEKMGEINAEPPAHLRLQGIDKFWCYLNCSSPILFPCPKEAVNKMFPESYNFAANVGMNNGV